MKKISRRELARTITRQLLAGTDRPRLVRQLAAYLVDHKITGQLDMLISDISAELQATTGHVSAVATTAFPVSERLLDELRQSIRLLTNARAVELTNEVDSQLVGGVIVKLPGKEMDASVRRKLTLLARGGV